MNSRKLEFADEVVHCVCELCGVIYNIRSDEQLEKVFGISHEQMKSVIQKIIDALPDSMFDRSYQRSLDEIKNICAREYIFFQAQEKWNDPHYQDDLLNFIYIFSRDIQQRVNVYKNYKSKMKEE